MRRPLVTPRRAEEPLVLALDVGSSNVRALLFDGRGREVAGCREVHTYETTTAGAERNAERLLKLVCQSIDGLLGRAGKLAGRVEAVSVCTFVANVMGVDGQDRPVTPLYCYADDRGWEQVRALRASLEAQAYHQRTGCFIHPAYLPVRLAWLAQERPTLYRRARAWISFGEYLERRLLGESCLSLSVASWTGLLDRRRLIWDRETLRALDLSADRLTLPTHETRGMQRCLRPAYARRWPQLARATWFPAVADGAAANIGTGCATPNWVALTVGTTCAVRVAIPGTPARVPDGLWCYRLDEKRSLLGGALNEGGGTFAWLGRMLRLPAHKQLEQALAKMAPDDHGLTVLPWFRGERSPGWSAGARATIHGLTEETTPPQLVRAVLESISCRLALVLEILRPHLPAGFRVVASGGALCASPAWQQITADALGVPLTLSATGEASARGSALMAIAGLGRLKDCRQASPPLGRTVNPLDFHHGKYRRAIERQKRLARVLTEAGLQGVG